MPHFLVTFYFGHIVWRLKERRGAIHSELHFFTYEWGEKGAAESIPSKRKKKQLEDCNSQQKIGGKMRQ